MEEIWKTIENFENYEISNLGIIRNKKTKLIRKQSTHKDGYKRIVLIKDNKLYFKTVHRLVALAFVPNPDNLSDVDHIDNNKSNNAADNLQWLSHKDNQIKKMIFYNGQIAQKQKKTCYKKKIEKEKNIPIKKRCYLFNNIIFWNQKDIFDYLCRYMTGADHFLGRNKIKKNYNLLLLNGKIKGIEDKYGNLIYNEQYIYENNISFYNCTKRYTLELNMKLLKAQHEELGTWYFTNVFNAANYTHNTRDEIKICTYEQQPINGWLYTWVDNVQISSKQINPNKNIITKDYEINKN